MMRARVLLVALLIAMGVGTPLILANALAVDPHRPGPRTALVTSADDQDAGASGIARGAPPVVWTPVYEGSGPTKVGILGDSIANTTLDDLTSSLSTAPYQLTSATFPGLTLETIVVSGWPSHLAGTHPDHVVVIAGTNDINEVFEPWNGLVTLAEQGALVDALPFAEIHWVRPYLRPSDPAPGLLDQAQGFNDGLGYWAAHRSNLHLVDWPACISYFTARGVVVLRPDGIHPTDEGQTLLAYVVTRSILESTPPAGSQP